jgi:hypothetical protein
MPEPRMHHCAVVFRGKIYVLGGIGAEDRYELCIIEIDAFGQAEFTARVVLGLWMHP